MSVVFADDFDQMLPGTSPPDGYEVTGAPDASIVTNFSYNGVGNSVINLNGGGMAKGIDEGFPSISSMTLYCLVFAGPSVGYSSRFLICADQDIIHPLNITAMIYLRFEPDATISIFGGDDTLIANSGFTPPGLTNSWNLLQFDLETTSVTNDLMISVLAVKTARVFWNGVKIIDGGGSTGIAIASLPNMSDDWNYMSFFGATPGGFIDNLSVNSLGDANPFTGMPKARVSQLVNEYLLTEESNGIVSQLVSEHVDLPGENAVVGQLVVELIYTPGAGGGGFTCYEA